MWQIITNNNEGKLFISVLFPDADRLNEFLRNHTDCDLGINFMHSDNTYSSFYIREEGEEFRSVRKEDVQKEFEKIFGKRFKKRFAF